MNKLNQITVFVKVAEKGSFTAAANTLNMSSQAIGKHIA
ncbi:LysR family transcriptional regulator [Neisseriaceae bacterium B1]